MSRRTRFAGPAVTLALALVAAAPAGAATAPWQAADRVPHDLPSTGARAAAATRDWIVGARASAGTAAIARAHGAQALRLPGAYSLPAGRARAFATALRRHGLLAYSEPDRTLHVASAFEADGQANLWARGSVVPPDLTPPAAGAPIGIVDDLVDATVPDDAQAKTVKGSATNQVLEPHGTEVASVAAGQANGSGVIGIMPGAPVLSFGLKTLSCKEVTDGILAIAAAGARVLNLSLGTTDDCFLLRLATSDAFASDTLVVAASGNEFQSGNPLVYPAAYPHVLSVGALDVAMQPTYFSTSNAAMDLAAPGEDIPVAVPPVFDHDGNQDGVTTADGTSFAAPIVSGVASWLIGARPNLAPGQYADLLRDSAKDLGAPGWDPDTGFGMVNLAGALQAPTPPLDRYEPNDGITFVDGTAYSKPDPYVWQGGVAKTVKASVDAAEDPVDVYRIRLGGARRATIRLTPGKGNADLAVYDGSAHGLDSRPLARSQRGSGKDDIAHVTNRSAKARTFYVAVLAPSLKTRSFDAQYTLKISRDR
jgi:Subtilase family